MNCSLYKNWSFSIFALVLYLVTFELWRHFPEEESSRIIGCLSLLLYFIVFTFSYKKSYFLDRVDLNLHIIVSFDLILETFIYDLKRLFEFLTIIEPGKDFQFKAGHDFYFCATLFTFLIWRYRNQILKKALL
jgi:hypothetical protein